MRYAYCAVREPAAGAKWIVTRHGAAVNNASDMIAPVLHLHPYRAIRRLPAASTRVGMEPADSTRLRRSELWGRS